MPRKHPWTEMKALYVEGEVNEDGDLVFPTMREVAERFDADPGYVRRKAADENWTQEQRIYQTKIEQQRQEKKIDTLAADAAEFDAAVLKAAKAGVQFITAHFARAQQQFKKNKKPMDTQELERLARALSNYQKVGRLSLGETTESVEGKDDRFGFFIAEKIKEDPEAYEAADRILERLGNGSVDPSASGDDN